MQAKNFLFRFPALRSRHPDELVAWLAPLYQVSAVDMPEVGRNFDCAFNYCALPSISLAYATYGTPVRAQISQNNYFSQGFPLRGSGEVRWNRHSANITAMHEGISGGPGSNGQVAYGAGFAHLVLTMSPATLTRKLSALVGCPIDPPLQLTGRPNPNREHVAAQFRLMRYLIAELDERDAPLPPLALAEMEQALVVSYLLANNHNYSHLLHETPRGVAAWQIRRAVDFVEAHWDEPITIEVLAAATQTTTRSLFYHFRRTYGISPMIYVNRVRLRHANAMLSNPSAQTSVTSVGFQCGFTNMGHFARKYQEAFGERPSDTLKAYR